MLLAKLITRKLILADFNTETSWNVYALVSILVVTVLAILFAIVFCGWKGRTIYRMSKSLIGSAGAKIPENTTDFEKCDEQLETQEKISNNSTMP